MADDTNKQNVLIEEPTVQLDAALAHGPAISELVVVAGPYRGHRIQLSRDSQRIGRDRTCDIHLDDESASRFHTEIIRKGDKYFVHDIKSTNGTYLNDARVTDAELHNGDRIAVGGTVLLYQINRRKMTQTPQVTFSDDHASSVEMSLSLSDSRFLQMRDGTPLAEAQGQFTQLYEFMVDLASILHQPALLERSLEHFFNAFTADRGLILLVTPDGEPGLKMTRIRDGVTEKNPEANNINISRVMAQQLLQKRESFLSANAQTDDRLSTSDSLKNMRVHSIMGAPLMVKDKILGMIYLDTFAGGKPFTESNLRLCTAMALQLSVCLENTRLYTELLNAVEFNNSVLRSLASGVIVSDNSGRVLRVNKAAQEILGKTEAQLSGRSLLEFPELAELARVIHNTLSSGLPEDRYEVMVKTPAGSIPLGLTASALSCYNGELSGAVANFRNLAPLRKLEEQVRRSHHLAALGHMAAGVAHEIRNPLNAIRGYAGLIRDKKGGPEAMDEYTQIILEEVERMNHIVQDMLDFSRERTLTVTTQNMNEVLEGLVRDMQLEAGQRNVLLDYIADSDLPPILGNGDKLRQVFRNIIINAMQACSPGKGRVTVSLQTQDTPPDLLKEKESKFTGGKELVISVEDNGCGMDQAVISRIFDPFFTQKETGTGLGLSISQKIIEQHTGRIEVRSEKGKGSTFIISLPTYIVPKKETGNTNPTVTATK